MPASPRPIRPGRPATRRRSRDAPIIPAIADYYLTNPISRASATMQECSRIYTHGGEIEAPKQAAE